MFPPGTELPFIVKQTMMTIINDFRPDLSVYTRTAIIRLAHTLNIKSQLYKIPLTIDELHSSVDNIVALAADRRLDSGVKELWGDGSLEEHVVKEVPEVKSRQKVSEPNNVVPCIQTMYRRGPVEGTRNNT